MTEIGVNVPFLMRRAAAKMRQDALHFLPGGHDETWRFALADLWEELASEMEVYGAREVPFIGREGVEPGATIVVGTAGMGNGVWTRALRAARVYLGEEPRDGAGQPA